VQLSSSSEEQVVELGSLMPFFFGALMDTDCFVGHWLTSLSGDHWRGEHPRHIKTQIDEAHITKGPPGRQ
jgi:hypothetical protein